MIQLECRCVRAVHSSSKQEQDRDNFPCATM
jgi:hypothetical protein